MQNLTNLFLFCEDGFNQKNNIRSLISQYNIPFKEVDSIANIFLLLKYPSNYFVLAINNKSTYNAIVAHLSSANIHPKQVFVIFQPNNKQKPPYCQEIEKLNNFILSNIQNKNISTALQTPSLIEKVVRLELENIGILKKYIGFKYLVDLLSIALKQQIDTPYNFEIFTIVGSLNNCLADTIEHDIRHMIISCWKNNQYLKDAVNYKNNSHISAKNIVNKLIIYLKKSIFE